MQNADRAGETPVYVNSSRRVMAIFTSAAVAWTVVTFAEVWRLSEVLASTALVIGGALGPVVMFATVGAGLIAWFLEPHDVWGLPRMRNALRRDPAFARRLAFGIACTCWASLLAVCTLGAVGLAGLASDQGWQRGAAWSSVVVLALGSLLALAAAWAVSRFAVRTKPTFSLAVAALAVGLALLSVFLGETSGAGGVLGMWGVFRREELDLTLPAYGLVIMVLGYQLPLFLLRLPLACGAAGLLLAVGACAWSSGVASGAALQIERETRLAGAVLRLYQTPFDRDHDGFAGRFGGGDCDDNAPDRNPDVVDVAGNGIDEDCSGTDAPVAADAKPRQDAPEKVPAPAAPKPAAAKDLNVVLITVDTLRFDLGYAGYQRPVSPNIDALAKRSIVYDKAYSLASYTSKSLGPMLIGRYGSETNRGWMHFNKYPTQDVMVQERLKAQGVFTLSVQGHWYFKADTGLGRGFDVLDMSAAPQRPQGEGDKTVNSEQLSDAAVALLKQPERASQRFFMWVHYLDPHAEYVAHPEFDFGSNGRARYDGEIAFTDFHVGRVLAEIAASPFKDRTVVVLTSDHGEAFGEHGLIRHGFELWEELVRVPLLVYVPGQAPRHITERRSAIDIVPTLLDVFGAPIPSGDDALSGQSLLPEWFGETPTARDIFIDMPAGPYNGDRQAFISGDVKIITSNSRPVGLYNLASDPGETNNLSKDGALAEQNLDRMKAFRSKLRVVKVKPQ